MKIFRTSQIKAIDRFTIDNEPIASVDLMERAASGIYDWFISGNFISHRIIVIAGPGNNGGDGLAVARMLSLSNYLCEVWYLNFSQNNTGDWIINRNRLLAETDVKFLTINHPEEVPSIPDDAIIIDAILGSGLSKPVEGLPAAVIGVVNRSKALVISIDIPSGLNGEDNSNNNPECIIRARHTLTFQFPKLAFMFSDNEQFTGKWEILDIGLSPEIINLTETEFNYLGSSDVSEKIRNRPRFSHKGTFGHGLLIGGSEGKMGAVVLASKAAIRSGAGLISCRIPYNGNLILQSAAPEIMTIPDVSEKHISEIADTDIYDAIAIGPGLGTDPETQKAFSGFLKGCSKPLVIDADGINILSLNKDWLEFLPEGTIITPHPGEFERLAGKVNSGYDRLNRQRELAEKLGCVIVLKGANTSIALPNGQVFFNSTGNPGMATAGSGDVLTGMILALLAQGYKPADAALIAVYLHGMAGDFASETSSEEALIASDIISNIGKAFRELKHNTNAIY